MRYASKNSVEKERLKAFRRFCKLIYSGFHKHVARDSWDAYGDRGCQCKTETNDLLFGGVVELVLVGAAEALLYARIGPEPLHRCQELLTERLRVLHPLDHVKHHLAVALSKKKYIDNIFTYFECKTSKFLHN